MTKLLSGRRVLVVEDEFIILLMIEHMLKELGCDSVTAAATIKKALALIDSNVFDVAMVDMNLKGQDSRAVADALAARGVPFMFCTGNRAEDTMVALIDRPVLRKPIRLEDLVDILTRLLPRGPV
jgi:CheY-like chemotaxis protein